MSGHCKPLSSIPSDAPVNGHRPASGFGPESGDMSVPDKSETGAKKKAPTRRDLVRRNWECRKKLSKALEGGTKKFAEDSKPEDTKAVDTKTEEGVDRKVSDAPQTYSFDLVIIGIASGGIAAAKEAVSFGKKVALVLPVDDVLGIPPAIIVDAKYKNIMYKAAEFAESVSDSSVYGWEGMSAIHHDWSRLVDAVRSYMQNMDQCYRDMLRDMDIAFFSSQLEFIGPREVRLTDNSGDSKLVSGSKFLIALNNSPQFPDIPGALDFGIIPEDLMSLPYFPGKTLVVGGTCAALETAGFLHRLGTNVTVMTNEGILAEWDQQMAQLLKNHLESKGVYFILDGTVESLEKVEEGEPGVLQVTAQREGETLVNTYNTVIFATEGKPRVDDLKLGEAGVDTNPDTGLILGDDTQMTSNGDIYAVGDTLQDAAPAAACSLKAAPLVVRRLFAPEKDTAPDYSHVAGVIFTPLEYGFVGMTEEKARRKYGADNIDVYHSHFTPLEFALPARDDNSGYAKLICLKDEELVLGLHVIAPCAGEIAQGFAIALKLKATRKDFCNLIGLHPTCAEIFTSLFITKASGLSVMKTAC